MSENPEAARQMLRHTVATLAYRGGKTVRSAPASFADFLATDGTRPPIRILAHIGDLLDWALSIAQGQPKWHDSTPLPWDQEVGRFFEALARFDARLASDDPLGVPPEKLFQGPIADALTHIGQLAMLRRMAGVPMRGENYFVADVAVGRVGADQAHPRREFEEPPNDGLQRASLVACAARLACTSSAPSSSVPGFVLPAPSLKPGVVPTEGALE